MYRQGGLDIKFKIFAYEDTQFKKGGIEHGFYLYRERRATEENRS